MLSAASSQQHLTESGSPPMTFLPALDLAALAYFVIAWTGYAVAVEWGQEHHDGLNARMHRYREVWMRRTLGREARMVDMRESKRQMCCHKAIKS